MRGNKNQRCGDYITGLDGSSSSKKRVNSLVIDGAFQISLIIPVGPCNRQEISRYIVIENCRQSSNDKIAADLLHFRASFSERGVSHWLVSARLSLSSLSRQSLVRGYSKMCRLLRVQLAVRSSVHLAAQRQNFFQRRSIDCR